MLFDRFDDALRFSWAFPGDPNRVAATPEECAALNKILAHPQDRPCPFCERCPCEHWNGHAWINPKYPKGPPDAA